MTTVRTLVKKTMQRAGILTKSESPDADEEADVVDALNSMLESWSTDSLLVYARAWETFNLTDQKASYTIGVGGDFNTVKPIHILEAHIKNGTTDYNMDIVSDVIFNRYISTKGNTGIPYWLTFDNSYPLSTIRLYPVPSTGYQLFLLSEKPLGVLSVNDTLSLPIGWERAIINNLSVEILPDYGQPATKDLIYLANKSLAGIMRASAKVKDMDTQPMGLTTLNVYTGFNRG